MHPLEIKPSFDTQERTSTTITPVMRDFSNRQQSVALVIFVPGFEYVFGGQKVQSGTKLFDLSRRQCYSARWQAIPQ